MIPGATCLVRQYRSPAVNDKRTKRSPNCKSDSRASRSTICLWCWEILPAPRLRPGKSVKCSRPRKPVKAVMPKTRRTEVYAEATDDVQRELPHATVIGASRRSGTGRVHTALNRNEVVMTSQRGKSAVTSLPALARWSAAGQSQKSAARATVYPARSKRDAAAKRSRPVCQCMAAISVNAMYDLEAKRSSIPIRPPTSQ